jgi:hypothetical protein
MKRRASEIVNVSIYPGEHIFGANHKSSGSQNLPAVILYASPATKEFTSLHSILKSFSESTSTPYIFRYLVPHSEDDLHLPSYGVELAIKSLEYKVIDDSKVEGATRKINFLLTTLQHQPPLFLLNKTKAMFLESFLERYKTENPTSPQSWPTSSLIYCPKMKNLKNSKFGI